ncbi:MAG: hypothetical protein U0R65_02215 [Candidatus Nanopelagicales bacterium]
MSGLAPAGSVTVLGVGLFLLGLGWSCTLIARSTIVTDETAAAERPAVQGLSDLTMNVAGALGGVVAGVVVAVALASCAPSPWSAGRAGGRRGGPGVSLAFEHSFGIVHRTASARASHGVPATG